MPRFLNIAALLLVAGCGQQSGSNPAPSNDIEAAPVAEAVAATPALAGEWQVTKLDGRALEAGSAMAVTFSDGKARIVAGCSRRAWTFTQKRNIVGFAANPAGSSNCQSPPTAEQEAAFQALDRATIAIFDKEGREASLSGDGGNITLARR
jgi:hypothetical protein